MKDRCVRTLIGIFHEVCLNMKKSERSPTNPRNEKDFSKNCTCGNVRGMSNDEFEALDVNVKEKKCSIDYSDVLKMHICVQ